MDRLRTMLNGWYERNESDKKSLITQARHLSTVEDTAQAIEGVKRLNVLWKETGPVPRDQSQALWDEFRGLCDAVFQRREQAYTQYSAGLEAAKAQAVALCEQVEQAASVSDADRLPGHCEDPGVARRVRRDRRTAANRRAGLARPLSASGRAVRRLAWLGRTCAMPRPPSQTCSRPGDSSAHTNAR